MRLTENIGAFINDITGQTAANNFNATEAEKQRQFEKEMANSAYQRGIQDIKAAGLNPAMIYANGSGAAATPTGSSASSGKGSYNIGSVTNAIAGMMNATGNIVQGTSSKKIEQNALKQQAEFIRKIYKRLNVK